MSNERTILLVDDEENILRSLTRVLRRDGYRILKAGGGTEGLQLLAEHAGVGVILSDQRMPEMTGVQFLSKVRETYPDTVRMVLSGYTDLNTVTEAINQGAIYKFLTKPWEDELLRANVEEAFRYYELGRENERLTQELKEANIELEKINQGLEQRVEEKTREVLLNMHALQVSQEVLENLPVGVIGIDGSGTVVLANRRAYTLLNGKDFALVGKDVSNIITPAVCELCKRAVEEQEAHARGLVVNGNDIDVYCRQIGQSSNAEGVILVIIPVHTE
ncbi:MAG: response regulator [Gammaproteobacteria bacterium]|nr:response regulator [Gammaproteobacteria bacterium]